jgi:hypothetical protein
MTRVDCVSRMSLRIAWSRIEKTAWMTCKLLNMKIEEESVLAAVL